MFWISPLYISLLLQSSIVSLEILLLLLFFCEILQNSNECAPIATMMDDGIKINFLSVGENDEFVWILENPNNAESQSVCDQGLNDLNEIIAFKDGMDNFDLTTSDAIGNCFMRVLD